MKEKTTNIRIKVRLHIPFLHAVNTVHCVLLKLTLVWINKRNYLEIATQCNKRMQKLDVQTCLNTSMDENRSTDI